MQRIRPCLPRKHRGKRKRKRASTSGMTLIEVMIVMVIMALVAVAAGFAVMPTYNRARIRQAKTDAMSIRQMAVAYELEFGACPSLQELIDKQVISSATTTRDPWGSPFAISCDGAEPTVISAGPDQELNTEDDIS